MVSISCNTGVLKQESMLAKPIYHGSHRHFEMAFMGRSDSKDSIECLTLPFAVVCGLIALICSWCDTLPL